MDFISSVTVEGRNFGVPPQGAGRRSAPRCHGKCYSGFRKSEKSNFLRARCEARRLFLGRAWRKREAEERKRRTESYRCTQQASGSGCLATEDCELRRRQGAPAGEDAHG